jgi:phosphoribosylaminoimidazole-succinocarboxamide synthase
MHANDSPGVYLGRDPIPGLKRIASGKVRDIYDLGQERLLFVTTDRVSAFDVVMGEGIPHKGAVLTTIAAWWFQNTRDVVQNHLLSTRVEEIPGLDAEWRRRLTGRVMIVRRAQPTTVEWVVRGYLAGSGWKEYRERGSVCGVPLPAGLDQAQRLPEPILTPTTKDDLHDLPISPAEARERVGAQVFDVAERASLALFQRGTEVLGRLGILLADTKFEFGTVRGPGGQEELILIDEALTPDSSRFWPQADWRIGTSPPSYDKQILRDWLETLDWNKQAPGPPLDPTVVARLSERYLEVCKLITGALPEGVRQ